MAEALSVLSPALAWSYSYPARAGQPDLSAAVAFSQIVGPGGLKASDRLRLGLTLIAPRTIIRRNPNLVPYKSIVCRLMMAPTHVLTHIQIADSDSPSCMVKRPS